MKKLLLLSLLFLLSVNSYAGAICNDGWISKSSGSGTCSWHGGVKKWLNKIESSDKYENRYSPDDNGSFGKCVGTYQQKKKCQKANEGVNLYLDIMIKNTQEYYEEKSEREKRRLEWLENPTPIIYE